MLKNNILLISMFILLLSTVSAQFVPLIVAPNNFTIDIDIGNPASKTVSLNLTNPNNITFTNITLIHPTNTTHTFIVKLDGSGHTTIFDLVANSTRILEISFSGLSNFNGIVKLGGWYQTDINTTNFTRDESLDANLSLNITVRPDSPLPLRELMTIYINIVVSYCTEFPNIAECSHLFQKVTTITDGNGTRQAILTEEFIAAMLKLGVDLEEFIQFQKDWSVEDRAILEHTKNVSEQTHSKVTDATRTAEDASTNTIVIALVILLVLIIFGGGFVLWKMYFKKSKESTEKYY